MQDEPLTPEERAAFERLSREAQPPPDLEDRVAAALHRQGALRSGVTPVWARALVRVAAALVILAAGVMLGRATARMADPPGGESYLLLLYGDARQSGKSEQALFAEYGAWADGLRRNRQLIVAERLTPVARVLGNASAAASGPVGFFLIRAESFEAAAVTAAECPHVKYGGTIVVRPTG